MKIKHFGNVRLRTGNVDKSIGFTDSPILEIKKVHNGYVGEERRVTGVWTNGPNTTVIGEILIIDFISPSNGRRYLRSNGSKMWGSFQQYLNLTEPK
jgi:hypothetical protein